MATVKTWTAYDLELGALKITRTGTSLHIEQRYDYTDGSGGILVGVAGSRFVTDIELADVPQDIVSALATINAWLYAKCLEKEGMT